MSKSASQDFIWHVKYILDSCIYESKTGNIVQGINNYSKHALPSYIMAVAAIESFVNETLLSQESKFQTKDSPLWNMSSDWLERLEIANKLILIPQLLFNYSIKTGEQPFQDMRLLIRVRNDLVHYKMGMNIPSYIKPLNDRKITLIPTEKGDFNWLDKLSCTSGVKWAHNTACKMVQKLVDIMPSEYKDNNHRLFLADNFKIIPDSYINDWFKVNKHIITYNPSSNIPDTTKSNT